MNWGRWAIILGVIFALYFAFQGGEYGTLDLRELRNQAAQESTAVQQLQHVVDSLSRLAVAIEKDPGDAGAGGAGAVRDVEAGRVSVPTGADSRKA